MLPDVLTSGVLGPITVTETWDMSRENLLKEWINPHDSESNWTSPGTMFAKGYCRISPDIKAQI